MQHAKPAYHPPNRRGFSLTELLVVIGIAALLIGISYPVISSIIGGSKVSNGLSTVGMAVDVARQWVEPQAWAADATSIAPTPANQVYDGTAAIFGPDGDIRIVLNNRFALDKGTNDYLEDTGQNGYFEVEGVDYVKLPDGVGVVGIHRTGTGVELLAPPFAIAFNGKGHMNFGDSSGYIYYDADGDGSYERSVGRTGGYDPAAWNGGPDSNNADPISTTIPYRALPFEAIECVPGVIIYDTDNFETAGFGLGSGGAVTLGSAAGTWLNNNGTSLFFSPHTGSPLYDEEGN